MWTSTGETGCRRLATVSPVAMGQELTVHEYQEITFRLFLTTEQVELAMESDREGQ